MSSPRRTGRWFGHPLIVLGLALLLTMDVASIGSGARDRSTVREWLSPQSRRAAVSGKPLPGIALRTSAGVEWLWWDDPPAGAPGDYDDPLGITYHSFVSRSGFLHLTSRRVSIIATGEGVLSPEEASELRQTIVREIDRDSARRSIFRFEQRTLANPAVSWSGRYESEWPIAAGHVRNAGAATVLAVLLLCFFLGRTWLWIPAPSPAEARCRKRMQRGQCLNCGYDLTGIPHTLECPECGERRV